MTHWQLERSSECALGEAGLLQSLKSGRVAECIVADEGNVILSQKPAANSNEWPVSLPWLTSIGAQRGSIRTLWSAWKCGQRCHW